MVGRTVSHYQIIEKLGTGGMGEIYKALDPRLNRFVAIKVLPAGMSADPARRRRFVQEAQAASALNHPNIVTIYDVVLEQETEFMVMELVSGKTLTDLIPKGGLRVPQLLNYSVQMADALSAAHAAGIVHRDLKPGNVMITDSGLIKVLDFGLAKLDRTADSQVTNDAETVAAEPLTTEGSILGTVSYMSPEQAQGRRVDARSDIFSFGVMLYEMATGVRPFAGESPISTLSSILRDEARPPSELAPDVPAALQNVIARCLRKEPDDRWQSMAEVRAALGALKQESDSGLLYKKEMVVEPPKKRGGAMWVVAAVVIVALACLAFWLTRRPTAVPEKPPVAVMVEPPEKPERKESPDKPERPERPEGMPQTAAPQAPASPAPPVAAAITLTDGSPFSISLAADIPADAPAGTPIQFTVSKDLEVGGVTAIHKGAIVKGEIAREGKKKLLVLGTKMMLSLTVVETGDGHTYKVRAIPTARPDGQAWRQVDVGGRSKPKGIEALAGTQYVAYIDGDQTVAAGR